MLRVLHPTVSVQSFINPSQIHACFDRLQLAAKRSELAHLNNVIAAGLIKVTGAGKLEWLPRITEQTQRIVITHFAEDEDEGGGYCG